MKRFLVVFKLASPRLEHSRLKEDLARYSQGNTQIAFSSVNRDGVSLIGFFFTTAAPIAELTFDGNLFQEDSYLLIEIGEQAAAQRFGDAMDWLRTYRFR